MPDCIDRPAATNCVGEFAVIDMATRHGQLIAIEQPLTVSEHRKLETARPDVHDENLHR